MNQQSQTPVQQGRPVVSKWLWIVLIIVIVIATGFFTWYYLMGPGKAVKATTTTATTTPAATTTTTPSTTTTTTTTTATDATADWLTYANTTYGFSVKYPKDWTKGSDQGVNSSEPDRVSWVELGNTVQYGQAMVVVEVLNNTNTDIAAWATKMNNNDLGATYAIKDATVGGVAGKQLSTSAEGGAVRTGVIKGEKLYVIHLIYGTNQKNKKTLDSAYETILSTFAFTK